MSAEVLSGNQPQTKYTRFQVGQATIETDAGYGVELGKRMTIDVGGRKLELTTHESDDLFQVLTMMHDARDMRLKRATGFK